MISSQALKKEYHSISQEYIFKSLHHLFWLQIQASSFYNMIYIPFYIIYKSFWKKFILHKDNCFLPSRYRSIADFFCECAQF